MNKIKNVILFCFCMLIFFNNYVYGSFADYTDEAAEKDVKKLIEEHNNNFDHTKSNNNYLQSLNIVEGELSPVFDKQTIEYNLKLDNNIKEINISATAEDKNAKIEGIGRIELKEDAKCKIDVIAESGTVRSYFINIIKSEKVEETNLITNKEDNSIDNEENKFETDLSEQKKEYSSVENTSNINQEYNNKQNMKKYILLIVGIIVILIIIIYGKHKIKSQAYHMKRK